MNDKNNHLNDKNDHLIVKNAVGFSQVLIGAMLSEPRVVVDGTLGNGHDLQRLMQIFPSIRLAFGFDIQMAAIQSAVKRLAPVPDGVELHLVNDCHSNYEKHLDRDISVDLFTYNLGYLPGGDKTVTTEHDTVLESLEKALTYLSYGGVISVVCYPGHPSGQLELHHLIDWSSNLEQKRYAVSNHRFANQVNNPPELIMIQRISL